MSGLTPAIDPSKLKSQDPRYIYYVKAIVEARNRYNANPNLEDGEQIKILRYNALMENINVFELEHDVYLVLNGREPTEDEVESFRPYIQETYLTREMISLRELYERTPDGEKRQQLHQEAQFIRLQVYGIGVDPYRFENRVFKIMTGEDLQGERRENHYRFVKEAIQKYDANVTTQDQRNSLKPIIEEEHQYNKRINVTRLDLRNRYSETYSGADMVVFFAFPGYKPIEIGTASTVSYTTYRETKQLRTIGRVSAKGITKGARTISGRLIFTVIREHIIEMLRKEIPYLRNIKTLLMDELPPFDILVSFGNEYGSSAGLVINGVTTVDEQKTLSIEDLFTENIFTFIARALEPMRDMNNIDREYDPLEWFSSSFRSPGSEQIASFQPKELQLYRDAELLVDPTPFFGAGEGWDSSMYDWSEMAKNLGVDGSVVTEGSYGSQVPQEEQTQTPEKRRLLIQVAAIIEGRVYEPLPGEVKIYINNKFIKRVKINLYKPGGLAPFKVYPQSGKANSQNFPIAYSSGNVLCAWAPDIDWKNGDTLKVEYIGNDYYNNKTETFTINDNNMLAIVKTSLKGSPDTGYIDVPQYFNYINVEPSTPHEFTQLYYQTNPERSFNGGITIHDVVERAMHPNTVFPRALPKSATMTIIDYMNQAIKEWPVWGYWTLDLRHASKFGSKYDNIDVNAGLASTMAAKAWNEQEGLTGAWDGYTQYNSDNNGIVKAAIEPIFWTLSKKDSKGKRKRLYWDDLPTRAVVIFHFRIYADRKVKNKMLAGVDVAFIKG